MMMINKITFYSSCMLLLFVGCAPKDDLLELENPKSETGCLCNITVDNAEYINFSGDLLTMNVTDNSSGFLIGYVDLWKGSVKIADDIAIVDGDSETVTWNIPTSVSDGDNYFLRTSWLDGLTVKTYDSGIFKIVSLLTSSVSHNWSFDGNDATSFNDNPNGNTSVFKFNGNNAMRQKAETATATIHTVGYVKEGMQISINGRIYNHESGEDSAGGYIALFVNDVLITALGDNWTTNTWMLKSWTGTTSIRGVLTVKIAEGGGDRYTYFDNINLNIQ